MSPPGNVYRRWRRKRNDVDTSSNSSPIRTTLCRPEFYASGGLIAILSAQICWILQLARKAAPFSKLNFNSQLPTHPCLHLFLIQYKWTCLQTTVSYNHLHNYMYSLFKALIKCCLASKIQQNQTNLYYICPNTYPTVSYVIFCHMHISWIPHSNVLSIENFSQ